MSEPSSPAGGTLSPSTSAMDSGTFYSINDSDIENMNLSGDTEKSLLGNESEQTLTNLSDSTLNFLLDQRQNATHHKSPSPGKPIVPAVASSVPPSEPVTKPSAQTILGDMSLNTPLKPNAGPVGSTPKPTDDANDGPVRLTNEPKVDANNSGSTIDSLSSNNDRSKDESSISIIDLSETMHNDTAISIDSSDDELSDRSSGELSPSKSHADEYVEFEEPLSSGIRIYRDIEDFNRNLPPTVTVLQAPNGGKVYLVGTAHFSRESQDDVSMVIRNVRPDIVMVELCPSRIHILKHDEKTLLEEAKDINLTKIRSIIKTNGVINGLFYIVLLNMSAKLTKDLGMAPGGEFRRALEEVHRLEGTMLHLGDRPINVTLQRALNGLSYWQTLKIVWKLIWSDEKISKEDVEKCKQKDLLEELMQQMAGEYPVFRDVFVTERDLFMCHSLQLAALPKQSTPDGPFRPVNVVGVVGIGHCAGIAAHWGNVDRARIAEISSIPEPTRKSKVIRFAVKWAILGSIGYGVFCVVRPRLPTKLW